jgi:adenylate cyclase class IV
MNSVRKETEMRLRIDDSIVSQLQKIEMETYQEVDDYFFSSKESIDRRIFLRLRSKMGRHLIELKVIVKGGSDVAVSEAHETEIELTGEQYETMKAIFLKTFLISVQIRKLRGKGVLNGCELCYDKVEGLGDFLEIEGPEDKIYEICKIFGIDVERQRDRNEGYTMMMLRKKGLY